MVKRVIGRKYSSDVTAANLNSVGGESSNEWYRTFENLRPFLGRKLPNPSLKPRILHLGCGDTVRMPSNTLYGLTVKAGAKNILFLQTLPTDLFNQHHTEQLSVHFSGILFKHMQAKYPNLEWRIEDVRKLKLEDSSFDIAIDKASCMSLFGSFYKLLTSLGNFGRNALRLTVEYSG